MKLQVGIYLHERFDDDVKLYATRELAERAREKIAVDQWDQTMSIDMPGDPAAAADLYFEKMNERRGEYFSIEEVEVIGLADNPNQVELADLLTAADDLVSAFAEIGTAEPLNGANAIDRLNRLLPALRQAAARARCHR